MPIILYVILDLHANHVFVLMQIKAVFKRKSSKPTIEFKILRCMISHLYPEIFALIVEIVYTSSP